MKSSIIRISAIAIFLISLPLIPLEVIFGRSGNIFIRIKQNFQIIMFSSSIGCNNVL
jgi:hypothetical protein